MICWYCYWGWPKQVADIYTEALKRLNGDESSLHYGPAHMIWSDENFDLVDDCLKNFDDWVNRFCTHGELRGEQISVVKWSLEELMKLPEEIRDMWPEDYDGENPELYPPPDNAKMVKFYER